MTQVRLAPRAHAGLIGSISNGEVRVDGVAYPFGATANITPGLHTFAVSASGAAEVQRRIVPPAGGPFYLDELQPPTRLGGPAEQIRPGDYYFANPATGVTNSTVLGNGSLRVSPWDVREPLAVAELGASIITAGSTGAALRLVVYGDDGSGSFPGDLVLDAGQVAATAAAAPTVAGLGLFLQPGRYWVGAVLQGAPTTQPGVRCGAAGTGAVARAGSTPPAVTSGGQVTPTLGYTVNGVTAAAPTTFPTAGVTSAGSVPVLFFRAG